LASKHTQNRGHMERTIHKFILCIVDGAADHSLQALGGKTALQAATHPCMDRLASRGLLGKVRTIHCGYPAGTDAALLSVFGYDGGPDWSRGALEAAGTKYDTSSNANVLRCNLVSLSPDGLLLSHNGFGISDQQGERLMDALLQDISLSHQFAKLNAKLLPGKNFRCLIATDDCWKGFPGPHDHLNESVPDAPAGWAELLRQAASVLQRCSTSLGLDKARAVNGLWPWGGGLSPQLPNFTDRFGAAGCCISAVPVVKGIARLAGLEIVEIAGATGRLDTDWHAKAAAALASPHPFTLLHLEAPDECSHEKKPRSKVRAIEMADSMLQTLVEGLDAMQTPYRIALMADHYTSAETGRHLADPPPFVLYDSTQASSQTYRSFTEADADATGVLVDGSVLLDRLITANSCQGFC
jgi:2,3-bisphosphoglycerate-independent phosphoglycerate mutase